MELYSHDYTRTLNISANNTSIKYDDGEVYVTMIPNPSHLEVGQCFHQFNLHVHFGQAFFKFSLFSYMSCSQANNPVAAGKARAKQRTSDSGAYSSDPQSMSNLYNVMCLQVHGDASFSGQVRGDNLHIMHFCKMNNLSDCFHATGYSTRNIRS